MIDCSLHNRWDVVVRDVNTGDVKKEVAGHNIILNNFWSRYLSNNNATCLDYIHFGSGTDEPVATNTKLKTPIASLAAGNQVMDFSDFVSGGVVKVQRSCRIEANTRVGSVLAEVGFSHQSNTASGLLTHSLLKDANGNPLTITIGADEVVDIFGTFFFRIGYRHNSDNVSIFGYSQFNNVYMLSALACQVAFNASGITNSGDTGLSARKTLLPFGGNGLAQPEIGTGAAVAYDVANKKLIYSISDVAVGSGNMTGGICSFILGRAVQFLLPCTGFSQPVLTKEVVGTGDGNNKDFQTAFGYIKDNGTAKVYVNDVEVSATIDYNQPHPGHPFASGIKYLPGSAAYQPYIGGNTLIFENIYNGKFGLASIKGTNFQAYKSSNGVDWVLSESWSGSNTLITIPAGDRYSRFWKIIISGYLTELNGEGLAGIKNIHLTNAPASGSTVSVTYQPDVIAKDTNHTLKNVSFSFTFNEYTP